MPGDASGEYRLWKNRRNIQKSEEQQQRNPKDSI